MQQGQIDFITISQLPLTVVAYLLYRRAKGQLSLLLVGPAGIGKTTIVEEGVKAFAEVLENTRYINVVGLTLPELIQYLKNPEEVKDAIVFVSYDLSYMTLADIMGIPSQLKEIPDVSIFTAPAPFAVMAEAWLGVCFFDDIQNAETGVQRQLFEFIRSGKLGRLKIKRFAPILAMNPPFEDRASQIFLESECPPALYDRFIVVKVNPAPLHEWLQAYRAGFKVLREEIRKIISELKEFIPTLSELSSMKEIVYNPIIEAVLEAYPELYPAQRSAETYSTAKKRLEGFPTQRSITEIGRFLNAIGLNPRWRERYAKALNYWTGTSARKAILFCILRGAVGEVMAGAILLGLEQQRRLNIVRLIETSGLDEKKALLRNFLASLPKEQEKATIAMLNATIATYVASDPSFLEKTNLLLTIGVWFETLLHKLGGEAITLIKAFLEKISRRFGRKVVVSPGRLFGKLAELGFHDVIMQIQEKLKTAEEMQRKIIQEAKEILKKAKEK